MKRALLAASLAFFGAAGIALGQDTPNSVLSEPSTPVTESPFFQTAPPKVALWGSAEYLLWRVTTSSLSSPLVTTTSRPNDFDANGNNLAASLASPNTTVLFGNNDLGSSAFFSGGKFVLGGWLDRDSTIGVEARGFFISPQSFRRTFASGPDGTPVVGVPVNVAFPVNSPIVSIPAGENAVTESFPVTPFPGGGTFGGYAGSDTILSHSQLWGGEFNMAFNLVRADRWTIDLIAGFRYADLMEDISLIGTSANLVPAANFGGVAFLNNFYDGVVTSTDSWRTRSQFYGGQVGFKSDIAFGQFFINVDTQVALGATHQSLDINGSSTLATAAGQTQSIGGTLATQNNIGSYSRNLFSVIPELEVKLGYNFTERLRGFVGYDLLYWTNVARAGEQIDRTVDLRQVPTIPAYDPTLRNTLPAPQIRSSNFTAQGITFGFEFKF
jgi:hypothetical protein